MTTACIRWIQLLRPFVNKKILRAFGKFLLSYFNRPKRRLKRKKMSSTSQKHKNFVMEPMGDKAVTELAGMGPVLGGKLEEAGFDKAYVVLGQYLVLRKDEELFKEWLKDITGANKKQQNDCYTCLKEWCDMFL
ncbi:barrier-to-autointegration factor-like [Mya arenaria]|uniref:barrier-to-autointegration factor-like n=1 Tax=Mya arenaria TaxID=6604 RepID=UPI0022E0E1CC|nr:barrier-to-autointegration factor-like [Mya arenaria]